MFRVIWSPRRQERSLELVSYFPPPGRPALGPGWGPFIVPIHWGRDLLSPYPLIHSSLKVRIYQPLSQSMEAIVNPVLTKDAERDQRLSSIIMLLTIAFCFIRSSITKPCSASRTIHINASICHHHNSMISRSPLSHHRHNSYRSTHIKSISSPEIYSRTTDAAIIAAHIVRPVHHVQTLIFDTSPQYSLLQSEQLPSCSHSHNPHICIILRMVFGRSTCFERRGRVGIRVGIRDVE